MSHPSTKLSPLEFRVFRSLQALGEDRLSVAKILVACSGGRDSIALLNLMSRLKSRFGFSLAVAHVHHGPSKEKSISEYRDKAHRLVSEQANALGIEFFSRVGSILLTSEAELRDFRLASLEEIRSQGSFTQIAFGHHADDLMETRLIRLIRGTAAYGLVAMRMAGEKTLRPFLQESVTEVRRYAETLNLQWLDDPSNLDGKYLRNWIRNEWLPLLEAKRAGAGASLARSLDAIALEVEASSASLKEPFSALNRNDYESADLNSRRKLVADRLRYLVSASGNSGFTMKQVSEIVKRLDGIKKSRRRETSFQVSRTKWAITPSEITVRLAQDPENTPKSPLI